MRARTHRRGSGSSAGRVSGWKWSPPLIVALALGVGFAAPACREPASAPHPEAGTPQRGPAPRRVLVRPVVRDRVTERFVYHGITRGKQRGTLGFNIGGRLVRRPVRLGQRVRQGQLLGVLEDSGLRNAARAAEAAVTEIETRIRQLARDARRADELLRGGAATREQAEKVRSGLAAIRARLSSTLARRDEAKRMLTETRLTAPYAGRVAKVLAEPGEVVRPGQPIVALSGWAVEVQVEVPEAVALRLRRGQRVRVDLPLIGRRGIRSWITSLASTSARPGELFPVVVRLRWSRGLVAGLTAQVVIEQRSQPVLLVPVEAVVNPSGRQASLFRYRAGRVQRLGIRVTRLSAGQAVVESDELRPGDEVVVSGQLALLDGDPVQRVSTDEARER